MTSLVTAVVRFCCEFVAEIVGIEKEQAVIWAFFLFGPFLSLTLLAVCIALFAMNIQSGELNDKLLLMLQKH